jgi:hypothetical protein
LNEGRLVLARHPLSDREFRHGVQLSGSAYSLTERETAHRQDFKYRNPARITGLTAAVATVAAEKASTLASPTRFVTR